ncbi:hypothetical protein [Parvularcula lutaonensis]|uniref:Transmembrane protein n=1 Tax=Parvularcula lutaonensis TaxID=491923 RepID=A0ABV7MC63_9PROT|nr:hypothetical protein [Parvularcula lutaonensis]GGY37401.1 hypothetical protein GCM10007148_02040 [Parvularcula lutaonensis]
MNNQVVSSLVWAGLMVGSAAALTALEGAGILPDGGERGFGVVMGLVLAWTGNMMPKWGADKKCASDGEAFRMKRFAGITMMLGGIGYAVAFFVAPLEKAPYWAMLPVVIALLVIFLMVLTKRRIV